MGFKKYVVASVILMGIITGYVFTLNIGDYTLEIKDVPFLEGFSFSQTLPIFVWIIFPAVLLFIASIFHMIYYNTKLYFSRKTMLRDINLLPIVIKNRLLKVKSEVKLKNKELKEVGSVLNQLDIGLINNELLLTSLNEINDIVNHIAKINNGEYVSSKDLNILHSENPLILKNILNRVNNDDNFAIEVLKNTDSYEDSLVEISFKKITENKSFTTLKKLATQMKLSKEMIKLFLKKDSTAPKEAALTNAEILVYIQDTNFNNQELITIAKNYKSHISPEQLIKLYEDIAANDESLTESYLYVLFEFEMIEQIREILVNSQKDEYIVFKALLDLKEAGKHYSMDNLIIK